MQKAEILIIIEEIAKEYNWTIDEALKTLDAVGFSVDSVVNNSRFTESHVKMSVDFAYHAFR